MPVVLNKKRRMYDKKRRQRRKNYSVEQEIKVRRSIR